MDQVAEDVAPAQRAVAWLMTVAVDDDPGLQAVDPRRERRAGEFQGDRLVYHGGPAGWDEGMAVAVGQGAGSDLGGVVHVTGIETGPDPERHAYRRRLAGEPKPAVGAFLGGGRPVGVHGRGERSGRGGGARPGGERRGCARGRGGGRRGPAAGGGGAAAR